MIKRNELRDFDIKTKEDVRDFVKYIIEELKCNYHPDDGFDDMICGATGEASFTREAVRYLNKINNKCFKVAGHDYYCIGVEILEGVLDKLDKSDSNNIVD